MKRYSFVFVYFFCVCFSLQAATVDTVQVKSKKMGRSLPCIIILPDQLQSDKTARFPVVYLLHGHGGSHKSWINLKPELPQLATKYGLIIVCPNGENSWYWDSPKNPNSQFETYVANELVSYVDQQYPTVKNRAGRAITGFSMGGHGALWLAIRNQDVFGAAGSTSGGVDIRPFPQNWNMKKQLGEYADNQKLWDEFTVINLIDKLDNGSLSLIVDCGSGDFFFEVNNNLHKRLMDKNISHDYLVRPGRHNAEYWHNAIDYQLLFFNKFFQVGESN